MNKLFSQNGKWDFFADKDSTEKWIFRKAANVNNHNLRCVQNFKLESLNSKTNKFATFEFLSMKWNRT